ncbi:G-type lectin S-receptor-like serine/threonine-protein kinase [Prunus yedoensis var. nudiflora]|uniref:non-specific serine/threonine protein kinase n=1 Tax=Prunus yedoensis var. nudiflora TaxID=2094558 RepID=A0A314ZCG3_PRUYE|nr:G-type lectin S-receptor-like serine/threonine-protein kinase [Prunus yedoensis var. nudiflora]
MQALRRLFVCSLLISFLRISTTTALDTITPSRSMRDGETLVSAGGSFELGFFSPGVRSIDCRKDYLGEDREDMELPLFDLSTVAKATNDFSSSNKLGEGGFGPVYKGTLIGGKEIAVKRLSKDSRQGLREFKNEVILIARLQHRNLVKLLGCCIQEDEKILIYEFMPNGSLDFFIFGMVLSKVNIWLLSHTILHL